MEIYRDICQYCQFPGGEHANNCPRYSAKSALLGKENLKKILSGSESRERSGSKAGQRFEYEMFGEVDVKDPNYLKELKAAGANERGYLPYGQAMELLKRVQPSDPTNPGKDFLRELRLAIVDKLGLEDEKELETLRVYTAVGTPLDRFHGVDAVVSETVNGREKVVTLDATLRTDKLEEGHKADLMIGEMPSPEEDEDRYLEAVEKYAEDIANRLRTSRQQDRRAS